MYIAVIGTGYVGLVTGACFADVGNSVYCVDVNNEKIDKLKNGICPIFEPGLEDMLRRNYTDGRLCFTTEIREALEKAGICIIAVGTPMSIDVRVDMQYVFRAAEEIGSYMTQDTVVVIKSTVPVGTAGKVASIIRRQLKLRGVSYMFEVLSNPEFLKEGEAINDFRKPNRVIIGTQSDGAIQIMRDLYAPFVSNRDRFIVMDVTSAELTKYASNAMLAARISFMNEIAGICEAVGADINSVRLGMGADDRIGTKFLYAGCGYGGSCLPKDIKALIMTARDNSVPCEIIESVESTNHRQKHILAKKVVDYFGDDLSNHVFALWGLSFKPNTDDIREAPSLVLIEDLTRHGASLRMYDPQAMNEVAMLYPPSPHFIYFDEKYEALREVDALVISTEWSSFRSPDFKTMLTIMKRPIIFDGRNLYRAGYLEKMGFTYIKIG